MSNSHALQKNRGMMSRKPLFVVVSNRFSSDDMTYREYPLFAKTLGHYYLTKREAVLAMKRKAELKRKKVVEGCDEEGCSWTVRANMKSEGAVNFRDYVEKELVDEVSTIDADESYFPVVATSQFAIENTEFTNKALTSFVRFCWSVHQLSEASEE